MLQNQTFRARLPGLQRSALAHARKSRVTGAYRVSFNLDLKGNTY
jgi:hypothetical protein